MLLCNCVFTFLIENPYYLLSNLIKNDLVKLVTFVLAAISPFKYFLELE
jgi:hypothetical protein